MVILEPHVVEVIISVLYALWKARNTAVWDVLLPKPVDVWSRAAAAAYDWTKFTAPLARVIRPAALDLTPSSPLPPNEQQSHLHCYVDGGFKATSREATFGAMLLTANNNFVAAMNGRLAACVNPLMAETLACKEVLSWLKNRVSTPVRLYTDCSSLLRLLTKFVPEPRSYVGIAVSDCRRILCSFPLCSIGFVLRSSNLLAHVLACEAYSQATPMFWDLFPPDFVAPLFH
ncbi:uncharacterized protein LOC116010885 [Ipomoea triloba]|uniref:uncharacterized protein LOC116010885 n=1 Tax=Ipomoea triloba TaxID=35885 RepID=UPI00125D4CC9|nr:uncharacterized protein LOC116010885 [Ipomoea triloba]